VEVGITMHVSSVSHISEVNMVCADCNSCGVEFLNCTLFWTAFTEFLFYVTDIILSVSKLIDMTQY